MVIEPLTNVKNIMSDLLAGLVIGVIFFFGQSLSGHGGLLGWDFITNIFPDYVAVYLLAWWIVPFSIYTITPMYKKREGYTTVGSIILSFIFYSVGLCVSFIGFILAASIALSRLRLVW